jgi:hypothetical protein
MEPAEMNTDDFTSGVLSEIANLECGIGVHLFWFLSVFICGRFSKCCI